jgi:hypothetical protein
MPEVDSKGVYRFEVLEGAVGTTKAPKNFPQWVSRLKAVEKYIEDAADIAHYQTQGLLADGQPGWVDWSSFGEEIMGYSVLFNSADSFVTEGPGKTSLMNYEQAVGVGLGRHRVRQPRGRQPRRQGHPGRIEEDTYEGKTSLKLNWIDSQGREPDPHPQEPRRRHPQGPLREAEAGCPQEGRRPGEARRRTRQARCHQARCRRRCPRAPPPSPAKPVVKLPAAATPASSAAAPTTTQAPAPKSPSKASPPRRRPPSRSGRAHRPPGRVRSDHRMGSRAGDEGHQRRLGHPRGVDFRLCRGRWGTRRSSVHLG